MKIKFYFFLLLTALMMSLSFTSCSEDTDIKDPNTEEPEVVLPANPFTISTSSSSIDDLKASISINSGVEVENYVVGVVTDEAYAVLGSDSVKMASAIVTALEEKDVDFSVADDTYVFNGNATADIASAWTLDYSTTYVVAAFAVEADGTLASGVNHVSVTTDEAPVVEPEILTDAFEIEISDITITSAMAKVTPIEEVENYFVVCQPSALVVEYAEGDVSAFYEMILESSKMTGMVDFSTPDNVLLYSGAQTIDATLCYGNEFEGKTSYVVAIAAVDAEGALLSEVASVDFTTEAAPEIIDNAFTVSTTATTTNEITLSVAPVENVPYYFMAAISTKALAVGYGSDVDVYIGYTIATALNTSSDAATLVESGLAFEGNKEVNLSSLVSSGLEAGTEYTFIAVGVSADCSIITTTTTYKESTEEPLPSNAFKFEVTDLTTTTASINVTPTEDVTNYYVVCQPYQTAVDYTGGDVAQLYNMLLANDIMFGMTDFSTPNNGINLFAGAQAIDPTICLGSLFTPATSYVFAAAGVDEAGVVTTEVSFVNFTTEAEGEPVDPFVFTLGEVTSSDATITVTPDVNVPYYFARAIPAEVVNSYYGGDITSYIKGEAEYYLGMADPATLLAGGMIYAGEKTLIFSSICGALKPETEYYFVAIGVSASKELLGSMSITITTPAEEVVEPIADPFTFTLGEVTSSEATVTVTPDAQVPYYCAKAIPASVLNNYYAGDIEAYIKGEAEYLLGMADPATLCAGGMLFAGEQSINCSKICGTLQPGTEYYFAAIGISATKELLGSEHITFTTPAE